MNYALVPEREHPTKGREQEKASGETANHSRPTAYYQRLVDTQRETTRADRQIAVRPDLSISPA
jgi:hypothetical protein